MTHVTVVPARCLPTPGGTYNTTRMQAKPRAQTLPRPSPASATCSRKSHRRPLLQLWRTHLRILERARSRPRTDFRLAKPDSNLDIRNGKAPSVTIYCKADVLLRAFLPYSVLCQPLWHGKPLVRGAQVRDQALSPGLGSQQKSSGHKSTSTRPCYGPYHLQGHNNASSPYTANSSTPSSPP
jgi:hypothetical protein